MAQLSEPFVQPHSIETDWRLVGAERWIPLLLIAVGCIAYCNSLHGAFLLDDTNSILNNPHVMHPTGLLDAAGAPRETSMTGRPLLALSMAFNYWLGGLSLPGYHLLSIAIHLAAGLTLFGIVRRTMLHRIETVQSVGNAWFTHPHQISIFSGWVAAIWICHPLQTESVTYLTQRAESLCGLFYLLALYCYIRAQNTPRRWVWLGASLFSTIAAMLSKEVAATAPAMIFLYAYVFGARPLRSLLRREAIYFLLLAGTMGVMGYILLGAPRGAASGFAPNLDFAGFVRSEPMVILYYLRLCFWPHPLVMDYRWPMVARWSAALAPSACVALLLGLSVWGLVRRHWLGFVGFAFFLILSPTSSIVPQSELIFEHRMYLPLACVVIIALAGLRQWLDRSNPLRAADRFNWILAPVLVALIVVTLARNVDYQSPLRMWTQTLRYVPDNPRPMVAIGDIIMQLGDHAGAVYWYQRALAADPNFSAAYDSMARLYLQDGRYADARAFLSDAVAKHPEYAKGWLSLAQACDALGDYDGERQALQKLKRFPGGRAAACGLLGRLDQRSGRTTEARAEYEELLKLDPNSPIARNGLQLLGATIGETAPPAATQPQ